MSYCCSAQTVEELSNHSKLLQSQLSEIHETKVLRNLMLFILPRCSFSYWSDPDKINDIDHIRAMEESLKESLSRIRSHKLFVSWLEDDFGKQQLMPLECTSQFQNGIHLPLGMEGEQEAQPISWLHNSDSQHMMLSEDPNLLPQSTGKQADINRTA